MVVVSMPILIFYTPASSFSAQSADRPHSFLRGNAGRLVLRLFLMSWRWIRRVFWVLLLIAMAVVPARIAQSPEAARAGNEAVAAENGRQGVSSASVVTWIVLGIALMSVPLVMRLRRRAG
jgi:hypothetical protein